MQVTPLPASPGAAGTAPAQTAAAAPAAASAAPVVTERPVIPTAAGEAAQRKLPDRGRRERKPPRRGLPARTEGTGLQTGEAAPERPPGGLLDVFA